MASSWIVARTRSSGVKRFEVRYRVGGREAKPRYAGSFATRTQALARRRWVEAELAALRVPDVRRALEQPARSPTLREAADSWRASRIDVRASTNVQHRTAVERIFRVIAPTTPIDAITATDVSRMVTELSAAGAARETVRKSLTALAMTLDFAGVAPNPARDRVHVRLPRSEAQEPEPPSAEHVEKVARLLPSSYRLALCVLDATGCRVGELEAARVGDLDEERQGWLVRGAVSKTRRPRWIELPDVLWTALLERLPPREDRDPAAPLFGDATADRLRMAILRACKAAAVPSFGPHALRHRRISLMHKRGLSWAEIGALVGQRSRLVTADVYSHAMIDTAELDYEGMLR